MEQRTPEWFAARKGRLTGSIAGAALGLAPYMSQDDALRSIAREFHDLPTEFEGNIATDHGVNFEDQAALAYEFKTGNDITKVGFLPIDDWSGASPDGLISSDGSVEIKCPFGQRNNNPPVFKSISEQPHYYAQMQIQMLAADLQWCDFWQWTQHGDKLERVDRDEEWLAENMPLLKEFWAKAIKTLKADVSGPKRILIDTPEASRLSVEYDELSDAEENAAKRKKDIVVRMTELTGGKDGLIAGRKLTMVSKKGSVSYAKALKALSPDADLEPYRGNPSRFWKLS
jgi:putative phage-type endonuclease